MNLVCSFLTHPVILAYIYKCVSHAGLHVHTLPRPAGDSDPDEFVVQKPKRLFTADDNISLIFESFIVARIT